jgi:hypothetical protein
MMMIDAPRLRAPMMLTDVSPKLEDKFPSSAAFDAINSALNATEEDRKDAIKQGNAVFAFTLKNSVGETESWHIDLKNTGKVAKGLGEKPNGTYPPSHAFHLPYPHPWVVACARAGSG